MPCTTHEVATSKPISAGAGIINLEDGTGVSAAYEPNPGICETIAQFDALCLSFDQYLRYCAAAFLTTDEGHFPGIQILAVIVIGINKIDTQNSYLTKT